eukprot:Nk52_evm33s233 gene=Nk52_evmTU33s233
MIVYDCVLIDLSGTIHIEDQLIPGVQESLNQLQNHLEQLQNYTINTTGTTLRPFKHARMRFVTNTTKQCRRSIVKKLKRVGLEIHCQQISSSLSTAAEWMRSQNLTRPFMLLTEDAKEEFDFAKKERKEKEEEEENEEEDLYDSVLIGLAPEMFVYPVLDRAFSILQKGNKPLIAVHKGRFQAQADGKTHLGPGCFIAGLEFSTGRTAKVIGKPSVDFFRQSSRINVQQDEEGGGTLTIPDGKENHLDYECRGIMIGDDVRDDVHGAIRAGLEGILVRTGKYRCSDEKEKVEMKTGQESCFHVHDDVTRAIQWIIEHNRSVLGVESK